MAIFAVLTCDPDRYRPRTKVASLAVIDSEEYSIEESPEGYAENDNLPPELDSEIWKQMKELLELILGFFEVEVKKEEEEQ